MILKRLGPDPHHNGAVSKGARGCPDLFESQTTGDFVVIGRDATDELMKHLPPSASCGPDERIVVIPRKTLILAKPDIPDSP